MSGSSRPRPSRRRLVAVVAATLAALGAGCGGGPAATILSPRGGAGYTLGTSGDMNLQLRAGDREGGNSYAWSDSLGLIHGSSASTTVVLRPAPREVQCGIALRDVIHLTVTGSGGASSAPPVTILLTQGCGT